MQVTVSHRFIEYDFTNEEVDFLKSLGAWEVIKTNLQSHEKITIEGYERFEPDES